MKGLGKKLFIILLSLVLFCGISSIGGVAFAQDEEIPQDGAIYTLTYPDGTVVTEKDGKPLTYADVIEALKEDNWKLLLSDQVSDADGKVDLPATWKAEGAIKIIETKVPAGYTRGSASEVVTDLKEKSATFVNPKEKATPPVTPEDKVKITYDLNGGEYNGSTDDIVVDYVKGSTIIIHDAPERAGYTFDYWKGSEYQPGDKYTANESHTFTAQWIADKEEPETPGTTTETKTPGHGTQTGDNNMIVLFLLLTLASAATITALMIRRKRRIAGVITILLVGTFTLSSVFAADGFVINKVDDSNDPVQGAVFDIYGKPEVSWEVLPPETTSVTVTKVWEDTGYESSRPAQVQVTLYADGVDAEKDLTLDENNEWKGSFDNLPKYKSDGTTEIRYTVKETAPLGTIRVRSVSPEDFKYKTDITGNMTDGFVVTNTINMVNLTLTKTWEDENDKDGIRPLDELDNPSFNTENGHYSDFLQLERKSAGGDPEICSETPSVLDNFDGTYEVKYTYLPRFDENGNEYEYQIVENPIPGYNTEKVIASGDMTNGFTLTNTHIPTDTTGIDLNVNFGQDNPDLSWVAKTVKVSKEEPAQRTIKVGGEDKEVYMYTYSNPDEVTYYGDMPNSYSVSHWYDANGNELDPTDTESAALIDALKYNAVLVNEEVTRDVFGGLFKDNITKNITVSGPNGFSKSYTVTLGESSTFKIPITDAGEYTITQELVTSGDINQAEFPDPGRNTGYTGIFSIQTAVVNVTKDGEDFNCDMNKDKTMVYEHVINNSSKPYGLIPHGDSPYAESNRWHQGGGTLAGGDTVTISNYMAGVAVK